MIAPYRDPEPDPTTSATRRELQRARRLAAAMLFAEDESQSAPLPPVPAWQAWILTAWAAIVAIAFVAYFISSRTG